MTGDRLLDLYARTHQARRDNNEALAAGDRPRRRHAQATLRYLADAAQSILTPPSGRRLYR